MKSFKTFLKETEAAEQLLLERVQLFEHEIYKQIPGTKNSFREDPGNTNTNVLKHSHAYAKRKGGGKELYSVNMDGTGHDGSSGTEIPSKHADLFRSLGYKINSDNILETLEINEIESSLYSLILVENA